MLLERTAQLRGLAPKAEVPAFLISRDDTVTYLLSTIEPDDRDSIALHQEVYRLLGLIPDDGDLLKFQVELLKGAVLGFYDPDVKALFVLDDLGLSSPVTRLTLVHEYTHALQDEYYDINGHDVALRNDWDAEDAFTDTIEGDARSMETKFLTPNANIPLSRFCNDASFTINEGSNIPAIIQRELNTPYTDGLCFMRTVAPKLPEGDDSILKSLPATTAQVLHPEKYLAGEGPRPVELPDLVGLLGPDWKQMGASTLGEFTMQNLLLLGVSDVDTVKKAAAGWGGDRWQLYGRGDGARLIEVRIAWDSPADASEFWQAFVASLNKRSNNRLAADAKSPTVVWDQSRKTLHAALAGDTVTFEVATDAGAAKTAAGVLGVP
jgi:hypothetical protein